MNTAALDWDLCRSFLAVMREGSLSAAARALGQTQPTLGRHIAELEQALGGVALFLRTPRGLLPTDTAEELRPHVEAMAASADALARAASGERDSVRGVVRVTASEVVGAEVLPPILAGLRRAHPQIIIELVLSNRTENLLRRGADIAVRMTPPSQAALLARRLGRIHVGLHARPEYLEHNGRPATLAEVRNHALIGFDHETPAIRAMRARGAPLDREMFALRTDSDLAQLAAIRAGFGIGGCQNGIARRDGLEVVAATEFDLALDVWLVMHEDLRLSRRVRVVYDHLADGLAAYISTSGPYG